MTMLHTKSVEFRRKAAAIGDRVDAHLELKSIMDALAKRDTQIKAFAEKATGEIKDHGKVLEETKTALTKISTDGVALQERMLAVEQKLARRPSGDALAFAGKTPGREFIESDCFKEMRSQGRGVARLQLKASTITSATTDAAGSVGDAIVPHRIPGIITPQERSMTIRDLLAQGQTTSNMVEYVKETGFTNNAAPVAEGAQKPQSDLKFEIANAPVRTIAHFFKASKQALDDVPMLLSYIDNRGRYGLRYVEEQQLLSGDGTGQNVLGLMSQGTQFDEAGLAVVDGAANIADVVRVAMLQVRKAEYRATGIVMHPMDWARIELLKIGDEDNRYVWANPRALAAPGIWGLPVVDTMAIAEHKFMVGAFNIAATVWDRQQATVEVANQNKDDFEFNLITIRVEERLALTVFRGESFVKGDFRVGESPSNNE